VVCLEDVVYCMCELFGFVGDDIEYFCVLVIVECDIVLL